MKWIKVSGILILLTITALMIPSCQATIEKEFEEYYYYNFFAFKVKVVVETEIDGTWRYDVIYRINLVIILTYIDKENVDYVLINNGSISDSRRIVMIDHWWSDWGALLQIPSRRYTGFSFFVKVPKLYAPERRTGLNFWLNFTCVKGTEMYSGTWYSLEPLYVYVITTDFQTEVVNYINSLENTIRNLMYVLISTIMVLIVTTVYFGIRKAK